MPFEIVRNDITNMQVDAIVNTANPRPIIGYGVDAGVHQKAGPKLLEARKKIGSIRVGDAAITPGFDLPAKFIIHAVGPVWQDGNHREAKLLRHCYERSLMLAKKQRCQSVAFPLISAGNHGFPKPLALKIAMDAISEFLMKNEMHIILVVFSRDAFQLSERLFQGVSSFIDENYILETNLKQYGIADKCAVRSIQQELVLREQMRRRQEEAQRFDFPWDGEAVSSFPEETAIEDKTCYEDAAAAPKMARRKKAPSRFPIFPSAPAKPTLNELLAKTDAGFSETLLKLIDQTGKKDSVIYSKANVSRQHFSKIRNNPDYKPTKTTAIAFAIALELDLNQTRDLIGRAGYALTNSSKFDVIIMYFIREKNYNMMDINAALFEFDQSLLGV